MVHNETIWHGTNTIQIPLKFTGLGTDGRVRSLSQVTTINHKETDHLRVVRSQEETNPPVQIKISDQTMDWQEAAPRCGSGRASLAGTPLVLCLMAADSAFLDIFSLQHVE
jgi:hypothetical protein